MRSRSPFLLSIAIAWQPCLQAQLTRESPLLSTLQEQEINAQMGRDFEIISSKLYISLKDKNKILNADASGDFTGERKKI